MNPLQKILAAGAFGLAGILGCDSKGTGKAEVRGSVPDEIVRQYDKRFSIKGAGIITERGAFPTKGDCELLYESGIMPDVANNYNPKFDSFDIMFLHGTGISPEAANEYGDRLRAHFIILLHEKGISGEKAMSYAQRFRQDEGPLMFINLIDSGIAPEEANAYDERFRVDDVIQLKSKGLNPVPAETANTYSKSFGANDITTMYDSGIYPKKANRYAELNEKYGVAISGYDVFNFEHGEIPFEKVEEEAKDLMIRRVLEK